MTTKTSMTMKTSGIKPRYTMMCLNPHHRVEIAVVDIVVDHCDTCGNRAVGCELCVASREEKSQDGVTRKYFVCPDCVAVEQGLACAGCRWRLNATELAGEWIADAGGKLCATCTEKRAQYVKRFEMEAPGEAA